MLKYKIYLNEVNFSLNINTMKKIKKWLPYKLYEFYLKKFILNSIILYSTL